MNSNEEPRPETNELKQFNVRGQIRHSDSRPLVDGIVRAFDKEMRSEQQLGEATTSVKSDSNEGG